MPTIPFFAPAAAATAIGCGSAEIHTAILDGPSKAAVHTDRKFLFIGPVRCTCTTGSPIRSPKRATSSVSGFQLVLPTGLPVVQLSEIFHPLHLPSTVYFYLFFSLSFSKGRQELCRAFY
jgi:hypothetical protein